MPAPSPKAWSYLPPVSVFATFAASLPRCVAKRPVDLRSPCGKGGATGGRPLHGAAQHRPAAVAERALDDRAASWRERALNAEALAKSLRLTVRERDARISDLVGQLFDPAGYHLADELTRFRELTATLGRKLSAAEAEIGKLQRSLDASRANVKRERERNVTQLFPEHHPSGG